MIQNHKITQDLGLMFVTNVRRLMARFDMTLIDLAQATGLDERTLRSLLRGNSRPHSRTLHRLAEGLGVSVDELFQHPQLADHARFDRSTNQAVAELIESRPELFAGWTPGDFDELFSRVGVGGPLTEEGALSAIEEMNAHRQTHQQVAVILESEKGEMLRTLVQLMYDSIRLTAE